MLSIRSEEFIRYERGLSVVRMEIDVDTAEEIPDIDGIAGIILYQGSIAWDISTGNFYGLTSSGEWILQKRTNSVSEVFSNYENS